jgi:hypothetical protein
VTTRRLTSERVWETVRGMTRSQIWTRSVGVTVLVLVVALAVTTLLQSGSAPERLHWRRYVSPLGRYTAYFPGDRDPTEDVRPISETEKGYIDTVVTPHGEFSVTFWDYPKVDAGVIDTVMAHGPDAAAENLGGRVVHQEHIVKNGVETLDYVIEALKKTHRSQAFFVGRRLYQITVLSDPELPKQDVQHFFDMFQMTPK